MSFYDLPHDTRFAVYKALEAVECQTYPGGGSGALCVAVAKGKFGALTEALKPFFLDNTDLYYFPLGSDQPDARLRHTRMGIPDSCWLVAVFR